MCMIYKVYHERVVINLDTITDDLFRDKRISHIIIQDSNKGAIRYAYVFTGLDRFMIDWNNEDQRRVCLNNIDEDTKITDERFSQKELRALYAIISSKNINKGIIY